MAVYKVVQLYIKLCIQLSLFQRHLEPTQGYIERFYNHQRLHATLDYVPPAAFERRKTGYFCVHFFGTLSVRVQPQGTHTTAPRKARCDRLRWAARCAPRVRVKAPVVLLLHDAVREVARRLSPPDAT